MALKFWTASCVRVRVCFTNEDGKIYFWNGATSVYQSSYISGWGPAHTLFKKAVNLKIKYLNFSILYLSYVHMEWIRHHPLGRSTPWSRCQPLHAPTSHLFLEEDKIIFKYFKSCWGLLGNISNIQPGPTFEKVSTEFESYASLQ